MFDSIISSVVKPVTGIIGAVIGGKKASEAADAATGAQLAGQRKRRELEWEMFRQSQENIEPWIKAGKWSLEELQELIRQGPGEFIPEEEPGYKFGWEEFIEKPMLARYGASGLRDSGARWKGLTRYAQDYAETKYDNFLNRYYQKMNPYSLLANRGQMATGTLTNLRSDLTRNVGQTYTTAGNIAASNYLNQNYIDQQQLAAYLGAGADLASGFGNLGMSLFGGGGSSAPNYGSYTNYLNNIQAMKTY